MYWSIPLLFSNVFSQTGEEALNIVTTPTKSPAKRRLGLKKKLTPRKGRNNAAWTIQKQLYGLFCVLSTQKNFYSPRCFFWIWKHVLLNSIRHMYSVNFDGKLVDLYVSIDTVNMVRFAYNGRWNFMNTSMSVWCVGLLCPFFFKCCSFHVLCGWGAWCTGAKRLVLRRSVLMSQG